MGKVKAKTIQERFGFRDEEIATPTHDKIVCWVADNANYFVKKFIKKDECITSYYVKWEPVLKNKREFEVGFMDLVIKTKEKVIFRSPGSKEGREGRCEGPRLWIEAKSSIPSLGVLFRQLSMYRDCLKCTGDRKIIVVCPDDTHEERIVGQGYGFVKAFTKCPVGSEKGLR